MLSTDNPLIIELNSKNFIFIGLFLLVFHAVQGQNCSVPFGINFSNVTLTSVQIRWTDTNNAPQGWEIEITPRNAPRTGVPTHTNITSRQITIAGLEPSNAYDLSIRTVCREGQFSAWNVAIPFTTVLEIPTACAINIPLKDNGTEVLILDVEEKGILGKDVFIKNIDLIIDHTWPADLSIALETPQKQRILLSNHNGTGAHHFGNPLDATCASRTRFSPEACSTLRNERPPFIGNFKPDTDINSLQWDTLAKGTWKLIIFDRALKDLGFLKYFNIEFTKDRCSVPKNFTINNSDVNAIEVGWEGDALCHSVKLIILKDGVGQDTVFIPCQQKSYIFNDLSPNSFYSFIINGLCLPNDESPMSCPIDGRTTCEPVSVSEDFDHLPVCNSECGSLCENLGPIWLNRSNDGPQDWLTNKGKTGTLLTGPSGDINENGQYIYIGSNPSICGARNEVILQSVCMDISSNASGCDMSYYYHMLGFDMESLSLQISTDDGLTWETLAHHEGNQGDQWYRNTLSLSSYEGLSGLFRFVGVSASDVLGQIALDQIEFYKSTPSPSLYTYYRDMDQDGFGIESESIRLCQNTPPEGYSPLKGDCDDNNPSIYPGAPETVCNGIDENCNGLADDQPLDNPIQARVEMTRPYCNGSTDGRISLTLSGGEGPYDITWNNGSQGATLTNLNEGIYFAQIKDNQNCLFNTDFYNLPPQNVLTAAITEIVAPSCDGKSDGAITVSHSIDNPPHSYIWSNGETQKTIIALNAGLYSVTVTDGSGCFASINAIELLSTPSLQTSILRRRTPTCAGQNNGLIELFTSGGLPPYKYRWNTGDTLSLLTSLDSGIYTCTVTDREGCQSVFTTELNSPEPLLTVLVDTESPRCFGERNGSIKTHTTGGTAPYTYFWNRHPIFTDDIFGLEAGPYVLTVTDRNGCRSVLDTIMIKNPEIITIAIDSVQSTSCQAGATGSISVSVKGGNGGFNYVWQNLNKNSPLIDSLTTGHYSLTVFDKLGCKQNIPNIFVPFVNVPVEIFLTLDFDNVCYKDKKAQISSQIQSGTAPFDYNWSQGSQYFNESISDTLSELSKGLYRLTVTDAYGCVGISNEISVTEGQPMAYEILRLIPNSCPSDNDGEIEIRVWGGQPPYDILWNNGAYNGPVIQQLSSGTYTGVITDSLGCTLILPALNLFSESMIQLNPEITHLTEDQPGRICILPTEGLFPYSLHWSTGETDVFCIDILMAGTYSVTVSDALNCTEEQTFEIEKSTHTSDLLSDTYKVYPNPFTEGITIEKGASGSQIEIYNATGSFIEQWIVPKEIFTLPLSHLKPGMYFMKIKSQNFNKTFKIVKI